MEKIRLTLALATYAGEMRDQHSSPVSHYRDGSAQRLKPPKGAR
jgi:hypothetical protein